MIASSCFLLCLNIITSLITCKCYYCLSCSWLFELSCRCYIKLYDSPSKSAAEEDDEMLKLPASLKRKWGKNRERQKPELRKYFSLFFVTLIVFFSFCLVYILILVFLRRLKWKMRNLVSMSQSLESGMLNQSIRIRMEKGYRRSLPHPPPHCWCLFVFELLIFTCGYYWCRLKILYWKLQSTWSYFRSTHLIP